MERPYKGKWLLLPVVLIALLVSPCVFAQETTSGLQGTVKDPSGAIVANANVEIAGPALIGTRKVKTDNSGGFRITALLPGNYDLTVTGSAPGSSFRTYILGDISQELVNRSTCAVLVARSLEAPREKRSGVRRWL